MYGQKYCCQTTLIFIFLNIFLMIKSVSNKFFSPCLVFNQVIYPKIAMVVATQLILWSMMEKIGLFCLDFTELECLCVSVYCPTSFTDQISVKRINFNVQNSLFIGYMHVCELFSWWKAVKMKSFSVNVKFQSFVLHYATVSFVFL